MTPRMTCSCPELGCNAHTNEARRFRKEAVGPEGIRGFTSDEIQDRKPVQLELPLGEPSSLATSKPTPADIINNPPHYTKGGIETIQAIEAWDLGFHLGNVVKYVSRAGKKSEAKGEDLKKARWYLNRAILMEEKRDLENVIFSD